MSCVTPRKRDAHAAELLQAELLELQAKLQRYQEQVSVFERDRDELQSLRLRLLRKHASGTYDEKDKWMAREAKELADNCKEGLTVFTGRIRTASSRIEVIKCVLAGESSGTIMPEDVPFPLQGKQYVRIGNTQVFIVLLDNEVRIFKYCVQYGEEVHRSWASAGLAPLLHSCKAIAGGLLEVQMEFLEDYRNAFSLLSDMDDIAKRQLQAAVYKAWAQASAIRIDGCVVAHGDMRPPNIMVRRDVEQDSWAIKFIDFEWAGKVGVARYPRFMTKSIKWHPSVGAKTLLDQCHDQWCLEQEEFWEHNELSQSF